MNKISFEEGIKQLEEIVKELENGNLNLDDSIELFEKGIKLSQICSKKLDDAEKKVVTLIEDNDEFKEIPFIGEED